MLFEKNSYYKKKEQLNLTKSLIISIVLLVSSVNGFAQKSEEPLEEVYKDNAQIESVERVIQVEAMTSDKKIRKRLESIFESSGKYSNLSIQVDDGLVFIEGQASEPEYVEWASDIAKNIEGVVAVVNNTGIQEIDYFTIEPIKNELLKLWFKGLEILPLVIVGISTFLFFFFLSKPISAILMRPIGYITHSDLIKIVLKKIISLFIILIGLYFFLRIAGLTQFALAVMSGTGVIGLIVGFAFRDIAENFISSLLLSVQRPFRLGDVIEVQGHKGVVRKVTARGTTLVDFDGNHIQIPNAVIYKSIIQNFSANPNMREQFTIGVGYDASIKLAQELAIQLMLNHEAVLNEPEPQILIDNLGSSTVNLKVYFWVDSKTYSAMKVSSILMRKIMRNFEKNGISMPDDAREVIFPQGVPVLKPESSKVLANSQEFKKNIEQDSEDDQQGVVDDLSSDTDDIRQQAEKSRDPEEGDNIL